MSYLPKISVITVTYNAEKHLERTIQSVLGQTYSNIEYIIVDGGSKDATVSIIKKYHDRIARWVSEPDKGIYDAMNKGISMATGDYINFMNADDIFNCTDTIELAMKEANDADFVYGLARIITEEGKELPYHKVTPIAERLTAKSFIQGMVVCHQSMIVKRSRVPYYDLNYKISADIDWSIRVLKNVKSIHYNAFPICDFLTGGFSTQNKYKSARERFNIAVKHFGLLTTLWIQLGMVLSKIVKKVCST